MAIPDFDEFGDVMACVEEALPVPDEQGNHSVTAGQIEEVKGIIDRLFQPLFDRFIKKVAVELDGEHRLFDEEELDALPIGTVVRYGNWLFVRGPRLWRELLTGCDHKNGHVFYLLTEDNIEDHEITVTTPR